MDIQTIRTGYAILFGMTAILHLYNARRYGGLVRASFFLSGIVFLSFAAALMIAPAPGSAPLVAIINGSVMATFVAALIIVQTIMALNGLLNPLRRRKGDS